MEKLINKLQEWLFQVFDFITWVYPAIIIGICASICKVMIKVQRKPLQAFIRSIIIGSIAGVIVYVALTWNGWDKGYIILAVAATTFVAEMLLEGSMALGEQFKKDPIKVLKKLRKLK